MRQYTLEELIMVLDNYLKIAEQTIVNNNIEARNEIRDKLHAYIRVTPQKYKFLDDIAREAIHGLNEFDLDMATGNIATIARRLKKQRAIIILATNEAKETAGEIQLENLIRTINDTTDKLEKLIETSDILDDNETNFMDKISALKKLIKGFQN